MRSVRCSMRSARAERVNVRSSPRGIEISPLISASIVLTLSRRSRLPAGEPRCDALETRPPQRPRFRPVHQRREMLFADLAQRAGGIVRQRRLQSFG